MNPADRIWEAMEYSLLIKVEIVLIIYAFGILTVLLALIFARNKKKLHLTSHRKFVNKLIGLFISVTNFFLFVPIVSLLAKLFQCHPQEKACFMDTHLALLCFGVAAILVYMLLVFYSSSLMTTCYPNENVPWAHFPSKVPYEKLNLRLAIVLVYQVDVARVTIPYFNAFFAVSMAVFIGQRLTKAMIFDRSIHILSIVTESILMILFLLAFLADLIHIQLGVLFSLGLLVSALAVSFFINKIRTFLAEKFLRKVDIFNYRFEFEALYMMIALHELIEMSGFDVRQDFMLRGFVERHIEICDFPQCNCLEYYKVINSVYRIQLATIATMKEDENNKSSI